MSNTTTPLTNELYKYIQEISIREIDILKQLREETAGDSMSRMQISPEQGQFMSLLCRMMNARKALEIGTYTGYSSISIALGLPENGKLTTCDVSTYWTDIAKKYWALAGVENKIELILAPAQETLERLFAQPAQRESFDFIFIDADKENYVDYYEKCLMLARKGGVIVIDNVFWSGRVVDPKEKDGETQSIRELNKLLKTDQRIYNSMLPISDGIQICLKK